MYLDFSARSAPIADFEFLGDLGALAANTL